MYCFRAFGKNEGIGTKRAVGDPVDDFQSGRRTNHEASGHRRSLAAYRTFAAVASATSMAVSGSQASRFPQSLDRHTFCSQDRNRLGRSSGRTRLWLWQNLPSLPLPVAPSWGMGETAHLAA